ncbi:MAG: transcriptional regulator, AraC family, partial [Bacteroidetes bacterium]|nr:transcriptional regulator, AraC family [Bacteroidota bacterium]
MLYITDQFNHVNQFFLLLDTAIADIRFAAPIRMRTVKEFAAIMELHPNYLNTLLKRHTGENVSSHIRKRLLEV